MLGKTQSTNKKINFIETPNHDYITSWQSLNYWIYKRFSLSSTEQWLQQRVNTLLSNSNQNKPPISLPALFKQRKILGKSYDKTLIGDAKLHVNKNGFIISIKSNLSSFRERSSIAHEIGHSEFYDINQSPPRRITPWEMPSLAEEHACNLYGMELLMPTAMIFDATIPLNKNLSCEEILKLVSPLQQKFQVSNSIVLYRLLNLLKSSSLIFLVCRKLTREGFIKEENKSQLKAWRVCWSITSDHLHERLFIPWKNKGQRVFPKVRIDFLDDIMNESKEKNFIVSFNEYKKNLNIGNLATILKQHNHEETINIFALITKQSDSPLLTSNENHIPPYEKKMVNDITDKEEIILGISL